MEPTPKNQPPGDSNTVPRRVWSATLLLVVGRMWGSFCTAITLIVLARHLTGGEFGRFTFYLAVLLLLDAFTDLGTGTAVIQRVARDRTRLSADLRGGRRIRFVTAAVGFLLLSSLAWGTGEDGALWIALAALYPFSRILDLSSVVFHDEIRFGVPVATRAVGATLRLGTILALVGVEVREAPLFVAAHAAGLAAVNALLFLAARPRVRAAGASARASTGLLRTALPLGVAGLCQQAYFYIDNLFVRALRGDEELGHYNAGVRVMSLFLMVVTYATTAALPWLARRHRDGELASATARLVQPPFLFACFALGVLWPFAGDLLRVLFGEGFDGGGPSLQWLLLATLAVYAGAGLLTAVVAAGRSRAVLAVTAGALAVNALGNGVLIPRMGIEGAAVSTLVTETLVVLGAALVLRGETRRGGEGSERSGWWWCLGLVLFGASALVASALR